MPQLVPFLLATQALLLSGQRINTLLESYHLPAPRAQERTSRYSDQQLLGRITDQRGHLLYYVLTESYLVQAALLNHGHSRLLFLNAQHVPIAQYVVGMPYELPYQVRHNALYFKASSNKGSAQVYRVQLGTHLPQRLCVGAVECYERESATPYF